MRQATLPLAGWRAGWRRHEHALALAWLILVGVAVGAVLVPATRHRLLPLVQRSIDARESLWTARLVRGEHLVRAGHLEEALGLLAELDRRFPARDVRHGRDRERERVLLALGEVYTRLGKKGKALDTYRRLAAFDPLNYRNHYALALASDHFLSGWALAPEARDAYAAALAINPSHLPSVRGYLAYYAARADWPEVRSAWQAYLDAFLMHNLTLRLGTDSVQTLTLVTGEAQDLEFRVPGLTAPAPDLWIRSGGYAISVERLTLIGALRPGQPGPRVERVLFPGTAPALEGLVPAGNGRFASEGPESAYRFALPAMPDGIDRIRLRIRLFKPADGELVRSVRTAYSNLLDADGLARADGRMVPLARAGLADSVLTYPDWATKGRRGRPDERLAFRP